VTAGPWPFGEIVGFLGEAPIHGRSSRGGGAALALRGNGSGGTRGGVRHKCGMRRGGGSGDMEGPRNAGNAYAGIRVDAHHDLGTLLSHDESHKLVCAILRLRVTGPNDN
jgi:hypothetical protein